MDVKTGRSLNIRMKELKRNEKNRKVINMTN